MKVLIPTPLRSYTKAKEVEAAGATLGELLADLDRQYPGIRFRVLDEQGNLRPHMRFFVNEEQVFDTKFPLRPSDAIYLVQALSGGNGDEGAAPSFPISFRPRDRRGFREWTLRVFGRAGSRE